MPGFGDPKPDWTDDYQWARFRGPQPYPAPADWVLDDVEGDGISWTRFPGVGEPFTSDHEVRDHIDDWEALEEACAERAFLIDELEEFNPRKKIEVHEHTFSIDGEDVFSAVDPDFEDLMATVAECLAQFSGGRDVSAIDEFPETAGPDDGESEAERVARRKEENQPLGDFS
jgi:hypothetical protein